MSSMTPAVGRDYLHKAIQLIAGFIGICLISLNAIDAEEYKLTIIILTAVVSALNLITSVCLANLAVIEVAPAVAGVDPAGDYANVGANFYTQTGFTPPPGYTKVRGFF
jgi:hypothetical protein